MTERRLSVPRNPARALRELTQEQRAGEALGAERPPDDAPDNITGNISDNITRNTAGSTAPLQESKPESQQESQKASNVSANTAILQQAPSPPAAAQGAGGAREERIAEILKACESDEMVVITARVPAKLNRYIDEFVNRQGKKGGRYKYLKQDALMEALAAFVVDHPLPPTEDPF